MQTEEDFAEDFEELFVTYTSVENLLYENLLIGILELNFELDMIMESIH